LYKNRNPKAESFSRNRDGRSQAEGLIMASKKASAAKPAPKAKAERASFISKAPIRRLMKAEGANLVAEDAMGLMIEKLLDMANKVTKKAVGLVKDEKRKRVTAEDIMWASK
jgi:histone H3/H4